MEPNSKADLPGADDDIEALRLAMTDVRRRAASERIERLRPRLSARPLRAEADERAVLEELLSAPIDDSIVDNGDFLAYRVSGLRDSVWRRLHRGTYRIGAELDLHGLNREKAQVQVAGFLARCQDRDIRCLRIIHGKGLRSPNSGPVLKVLLDGWLRRRKNVIAFCSAAPHDGGTGAVYVLLKRKERV